MVGGSTQCGRVSTIDANHCRRQLPVTEPTMHAPQTLQQGDPQVADLINRELERQQSHLELIASENFAPPAVMAAQGSVCLLYTSDAADE